MTKTMKVASLMVAAALLGAQARAGASDNSDLNGKDIKGVVTDLKAASHNTPDLQAVAVNSVIASALYDPAALKVCDGYRSAWTTNQCLDIIANRSFDHEALKVCDRYRSAWTTSQCLGIIANRSFDYEALKVCDRYNSAVYTNQCLEQIAQ